MKFANLDEFLQALPTDKPVGVSLFLLGSEFDLTKDEAVQELKKRGYYVAGATGELVFSKSEVAVDAVVAGADYLKITQSW